MRTADTHPVFEPPTLHLISSKKFTGWACSDCGWRWGLESHATDPERIRLQAMRGAFLDHRCADYAVSTPATSRALMARVISWAGAVVTEQRLAACIATLSMIWTVNLVTQNFTAVAQIGLLPRGPVELCAIGSLVWIHAKWRQFVLQEKLT